MTEYTFTLDGGTLTLENPPEDPIELTKVCDDLYAAAAKFFQQNSPPLGMNSSLLTHHRQVLCSLYQGVRYQVGAKNLPFMLDELVEMGYVGITMRPHVKSWGARCYVPINARPVQHYHPGKPPRGLEEWRRQHRPE